MKKTILFLISFAAVLALAVFLSPLIYPHFHFKFERIFNRIVMIGTLVCVAVFVRIRKETFIQNGLSWKADSLRLLITGFAAPVAVLSLYIAIQSFLGEATCSFQNIGIGKWLERLVLAMLTGLLIGCIEEFFFRGVVFSSLRSRGMFISVVVTNIFYSIVHFVHAKRPFVDSTPDFHDAFKLLAAPFASFAQFGEFWPGVVGLFIFGLMLTGLRLRTQSLYASIGLHAGAVFFIKTDGLWANLGATNLFWGSSKMYDGIVGWFALGVLYFVLILLLGRGSWSVDRGAK